jgi:hypothetical protein
MIRVADDIQLWVEDFLLMRDDSEETEANAAQRIEARIRAMTVVHGVAEDSLELAAQSKEVASGDSAA